jgi:hypothetical protein
MIEKEEEKSPNGLDVEEKLQETGQSSRFNLLLPTDMEKLRANNCCSAHSIGDRA